MSVHLVGAHPVRDRPRRKLIVHRERSYKVVRFA
jgi:hypothetical protein